MLDIKFIRENPDLVQKTAKNKGVDVNVDHLLQIDKKAKELHQQVQKLQEERNAQTKSIAGKPTDKQIEEGKKIRDRLTKEEHALRAVKEELDMGLMQVPNPAKSDVKVGRDESDNEIV